MGLECRLVPPHAGKWWSFQVSTSPPEHIPPEVRETLLSVMNTPLVRRAKPFLQGDCLGWLMIEFWTDSENDIVNAASFMESSL